MLEPFDPSWHGALVALEARFDRREVGHALADIVTGRMPEEFYALPHNATILALGFDCGVRVLRLATWGGNRSIVCVEPDPRVRELGNAVLEAFDVQGVALVRDVVDSPLERGARVDLLLIEPRYARTSAIRYLLTRYSVSAVIGTFDPSGCSDAEIYRLCSQGAPRFNMRNTHSGHRVIGGRHIGPHVSVIVLVERGGEELARTLRSLEEQSDVELEILLAPVDPSLHAIGQPMDVPYVPESRELRFVGWRPSVSAALAQAQGEYIALVESGDVCDPSMFSGMFDEAAPGREDIVLCSYQKVQYSDGVVQLQHVIGPRRIDLRDGPRSCTPGTFDGMDWPPILGRSLYRLGFIRTTNPTWDSDLGVFAATVFQAQCLLGAARIMTIGRAYLEHWETAEEMSGQRYRLTDVATVRRIFAALVPSLLDSDGNYRRELALRGLLARLYLSLYAEQTRLRGRWAVTKALLGDCLASMRFGSQVDFALRGMRRLLRR